MIINFTDSSTPHEPVPARMCGGVVPFSEDIKNFNYDKKKYEEMEQSW